MKDKLNSTGKKVKSLYDNFMEGDFFGLSAELSFYVLSSFFPMIILIFTAASSISTNYTDAMFKVLAALPDNMEKLIVKMLVSRQQSTLMIVFTGILTLITMTGFMNGAEKGLNRFYKLDNNRSFLKSQMMAIFFSVLLFISIILSFSLIIFGKVIAVHLLEKTANADLLVLWNVSRYLFILIYIAFVVSAIYKALPVVKLKIREVIPGALFTTVAWYVSSLVFSIYVNNFPQYEILYGSLAGVVCMIMWIYIISIIILAGAKINALIYLHKKSKEIN